MIFKLISELRSRKLPVGLQEVTALTRALSQGLHQNSFDGYYHLCRALLVHDESKLDEFEQVFAHVYKDVPYRSKTFTEELEAWLKNPIDRPELTDDEKKALQEIPFEELMKMFEERLREQNERHDGGSYWIGTGGRSPFGTGGFHPSGISLGSTASEGSSGGRSAFRSADARRYRAYRQDLSLDVRQMEVALRKLRGFERQGGQTELDLEKSIDATAKNFGELELVFRKPRRSNIRVILMMDVGGSMDPHSALVSKLFSAAKKATHWKELRTYYFHNCVYGKVYKTEGFRDPLSVRELLRECDSRYKLIFVGDASMAPYELLGWEDPADREASISALQWLGLLRHHFPKSVWLNPDRDGRWRGGQSTVEIIAQIFPMKALTLAGLEEAATLIR